MDHLYVGKNIFELVSMLQDTVMEISMDSFGKEFLNKSQIITGYMEISMDALRKNIFEYY